MLRSYVPADRSRNSGTSQGLRDGARGDWQIELPLKQIGSRQTESMHDEDMLSGCSRRRTRPTTPRWRSSDAKPFPPVRAHRCCCRARHALARASGRARLPAPGHPPARLRAEAAEAGIQARGLRAVRLAARLACKHDVVARADERAHPVAGGGRSRPSSGSSGRSARRDGAQHSMPTSDRRVAEEPADVEALTLTDEPRAAGAALQAFRRQDRPQRSVPLRIGQEVQAVPRQAGVAGAARRRASTFVVDRVLTAKRLSRACSSW